MTADTLTDTNGPLAATGSAFLRLMTFLGRKSTGAHCAAEVKRLMGLTDSELAGMGLTRRGVVAHVFERYRYA